MITLNELSEKTGVSKNAIWKRVWRGTIDYQKINGILYFRDEAIMIRATDEEKAYFSKRLQDAKKRLNLNRSQFAQLINAQIDTAQNWRLGIRCPNSEKQDQVLKLIEKALEE